MNTMSTPGAARARTGPSRWWYAVAAAIFAVSLAPTFVLGTSLAQSIRGWSVEQVDNGDTVSIGQTQKAVFVRSGAADHAPDVSCTLTAQDGTTYPAPRPGSSLTVNDWVRVGLSTSTTPPGEYEVQCDGGLRTIAVADNPDIVGGLAKAAGALAAPALGFVLALTIVIVTLVRRTNAKNRRLRQQMPGATG